MVKQYLVLELQTSKDIPDLADKIAGRAYVLDGVEDANIVRVETAEQLAAVIAEMVRK
jgi:hypothetical protein